MKNVVITGGTGLVGDVLCKVLHEKGYSISIISRSKNDVSPYQFYSWDKLDQALKNANYIIHLAGAGIVDKPWTEKRKQEIIDSRVETANTIFSILQEKKYPVSAFISSSAIGYYGIETTNKIYTETDSSSNNFLGETCRLWEDAAFQFNTLNIRTVALRIGIVLSTEGGALPEMDKPIRWGFGAPLGSGNQFIPWIHIQDLANMFVFALENEEMNGAFNAVGVEPINNKDFIKTIAKVLDKLLWLPNVPSFILKIILGSRAQLVLQGSRVSADKILSKGFSFHFKKLEQALKNLYSK